MSVINISYDTVSKEFSTKVDGTEFPSVRGIHIYKYEDMEGEECCSICIESKVEDEENDIDYMQIMTADHKYVKQGYAKKIENKENLYEYTPSLDRVSNDASKMLGRL